MRILLATLTAGALLTAAQNAPGEPASLDKQIATIAKWAAKPVIIAAVKAQNEKGPLAGMDNAAWQALPPGDPIVQGLQSNAAGVWLAGKLKASKGRFVEAFLSGAKGEKVAFVEKTTSYVHAGTPKFDVAMSGKPWQGEPELDASTKSYQVQISTPVLDGGKPIGVLVVGIAAKKPATPTP